MFPYLVCEFGKGTLSNLMKECFGTDFPDIIKKPQVNYIYNYLKDMGAQVILLEADYVDKDYLEDYSRYYVKCFSPYGKRCARLHFFKEPINHAEFDSILAGKENTEKLNTIKTSYLGFVVIKPIPKTFIGKTCLAVYDSFASTPSKKVISKEYSVDLFGIKLTVDTIAFQEQDKVTSACATTAIWSALHTLKKQNCRDISSLSEITIAAINHINNSCNNFPNDGLTNKEILRALDTENYRYHLVNIEEFNQKEKDSTFKIIKTYIDSGLPVILGANVHKITDKKTEYIAGHAVTILGYKISQTSTSESKISLYIHDDRLGPFARTTIEKITDVIPNYSPNKGENLSWCAAIQEKDDSGAWQTAKQILIPNTLIIPTEKKVRIPAEHINNTCIAIIDEYRQSMKSLPLGDGFEDALNVKVALEELSDIRQRIFNDPRVINKLEILTKSSARFLWAAKFSVKKELAYEILFDATDIPQGNVITNIVIYKKDYYKLSVAHFERYIDGSHRLPEPEKFNFLSAFISFLRKKEAGLSEYLDATYGSLRAPKYLRNSEFSDERLNDQKEIKKYFGNANKRLEDDFPDAHQDSNQLMIWAITNEGELLIGKDSKDQGHPTLTGFKPARIAGELGHDEQGWYINAKSGRYSQDYEDSNVFLENAKQKFIEVYHCTNLRCVLKPTK